MSFSKDDRRMMARALELGALGKGSTFSVTLPVQLRRQSGAEAQDGERDWGWNGAGGAANEQHAGQA